jgi:hypothetical protein
MGGAIALLYTGIDTLGLGGSTNEAAKAKWGCEISRNQLGHGFNKSAFADPIAPWKGRQIKALKMLEKDPLRFPCPFN